MSRLITIGSNAAGAVNLDVDLLLRTHMLVQASTGGGKSHLVRLMAEKISSIGVQTILIDPEGEFASLRHDFPFLLAGPGGDVPASPVSAALLARKLLELRANAVLDLFELNPPARIAFVAKFLEAMVEAPRELWHNVAIFLDEGQMFAPERSEAFSLGAVTAVATRGRKRGYGLIVATPRLSDFSKAVASQLQNVAVGPTFMDLDLQRAAIALSIAGRAEQQRFFGRVKVADPGNFIALGRAISKERVEFMSGAVVSAHPESSADKHGSAPPPAPAAIRKLLVHLTGLEEKAETEARTVDELKAENAKLREELASAPADAGNQLRASEARWTEIIEQQRIEIAMLKERVCVECDYAIQLKSTFDESLREMTESIAAVTRLDPTVSLSKAPGLPTAGYTYSAAEIRALGVKQPAPKTFFLNETHELPRGPAPALGDSGKRMLVALARAGGRLQRRQLATLAIVAPTKSTYRAAIAGLKQAGQIEVSGDSVILTEAGRAATADVPKKNDARGALAMWLERLSGKAKDALEMLALDHRAFTKVEIAERIGVDRRLSTFRSIMAELSTNGLIERAGGGVRVVDALRVTAK